jgi:hypothetical protein
VNAERKYELSTNHKKRLVGVQRSPLVVSEVRVTLSGEEFDTLVHVVDSLTTEVILGRVFLKQQVLGSGGR